MNEGPRGISLIIGQEGQKDGKIADRLMTRGFPGQIYSHCRLVMHYLPWGPDIMIFYDKINNTQVMLRTGRSVVQDTQ